MAPDALFSEEGDLDVVETIADRTLESGFGNRDWCTRTYTLIAKLCPRKSKVFFAGR